MLSRTVKKMSWKFLRKQQMNLPGLSVLPQRLIGVLMKPSSQDHDYAHLISRGVYGRVLAQCHSLEHSSGVHRQVFLHHEWWVFVSAN